MPRPTINLRARYWTQDGQTRIDLSGPRCVMEQIDAELRANDSRFGVLVNGVQGSSSDTGALTLGVWQVPPEGGPEPDPPPTGPPPPGAELLDGT